MRDFTATFSVPATREEVYRAITTPNSWWDQQAEGNAGEQGGEFHAQDHDFSVQEADDGKRVVWNVEPTDQEDHEWDDTSLIFDIEEDDDGETKVNFTHRGMRPHDRGYEEIAKTWKDRIAKGLQPLIGREENS
ncbi:SRPBCC family protein [Corynebacterium jeddahense]|uniref:SRPBCC family protein n=1 Tax=Corynebacterium jeddahense TaxID=1414719 RepID=UPI0022B690C9|nr:SRPBCC domain-containing protein [Corynebacterium jeddahense]